MKADLKKKIFFIILGIIFLPIIINYVLMLPTPFNFPIIGSNVDWLSFWGTYLGGIIGAFVSFTILYLTLLHNKKEAEIERGNDRLLQLKKELSERLSDIDYMPLYIVVSDDINLSSEIERLNLLFGIYQRKLYTAKFIYQNDKNELSKHFYEAYSKFILLFEQQTMTLKDILNSKKSKDEIKLLVEKEIQKLSSIQLVSVLSVNEAALKYYNSEKEKLDLLKSRFL